MTRSSSAMVRGWRPVQEPAPRRKRPFRLVWLTPLLVCLALIPQPAPKDQQAYPLPAKAVPAAAPAKPAALPDNVHPGLPEGDSHALAVPLRRLEQGRMLLIDETHPLPEGFIPADVLAILQYTQGRVACRDLAAVSGQDTLDALAELFATARNERIVQLTVFAGTRSREQQRLLLTDALAAFSRDMPLEDALRAARSAVASPDCSEHQTPWAVDIRVCPVWNGAPDDAPLQSSDAGRWLANNCWRFGFILRWPEAEPAAHSCRAYHLRYVGRAHAMLMHALNATFEEYLALLHQYHALTLLDQNNAPLACAVCTPAGEQQTTFILPVTDAEDVSLDNQGWAVASCLLI